MAITRLVKERMGEVSTASNSSKRDASCSLGRNSSTIVLLGSGKGLVDDTGLADSISCAMCALFLGVLLDENCIP